ncbi:unnamed protein product [Rotaria socialis]|uniref:Peptidase metallopeptidase domain-containing protein n=1 Tax=Rotaria socialis TaxID=392032 RepID=A0A819W1P8_9BILA|nr:unnamed protein product [Rotaria socialis]CAF3341581.1 unnamed protein product [Rotaria socialis]CAF3370503.1 unnamed protein product [Rotaria socialis]CAF3512090.1 unnamed protein product [Rotaria socialis]CAF3687656.1 unnamed protein product [Rotaria socialis]
MNTKNKLTIESKSDVVKYLNEFGYNPCDDANGLLCSLSLSSMLKDYQRRFRLHITGVLDNATKNQMSQSRCGNKDPPLGLSKNVVASLAQKWSRSILTWSLRRYSLRIGEAQSHRILQQAFDAWSQHIPLDIRQVCSGCSSDIVVDFGSTDHGDRYPFDGPGRTLAHAFSPEDGRIHFDVDEPWTTSYDDNSNDINFYVVAVHEIGHALGLDHAYEKSAIMYPSYQLFRERDILPYYDRIRIQQIYGSASKVTTRSTTKKTTTPRTTITKKTTTRTTTTKKITIPRATTKATPKSTTKTTKKVTTRPKVTTRSTMNLPSKAKLPCKVFIDAAFDFPDKSFHVLDTGMLRRYLLNKKKWDRWILPFEQVYRGLPSRITAGAYDFSRNEVLIFTSTRVYRYKINLRTYQAEYRKDDSLPDHLQGGIVGAISYQDRIHVIKAKTLQSFDIKSFKIKSNERKLCDEFPRFSGSVKAAFTSGYLHHFFTNDGLTYVWDEQFNRWKTFAKPMESNWFACTKKL